MVGITNGVAEVEEKKRKTYKNGHQQIQNNPTSPCCRFSILIPSHTIPSRPIPFIISLLNIRTTTTMRKNEMKKKKTITKKERHQTKTPRPRPKNTNHNGENCSEYFPWEGIS
jgi:hypothetical protein